MTVREFIRRYEDGDFDRNNRDTMIAAGWYDWFCRDTGLKGRLDRLFPKVKLIAGSGKIDTDRNYVFFKNNCPMSGTLYDDFRFCDKETGEVIFSVVPRTGHTAHKGRAELWGRENKFEKPLVEGTWKQIRDYFGV
jgi:hypothetical protein